LPGPRVAIKTVKKNPNPGGQCACSPNSKVMDCQPPYCVFTHSESMNVRAPHIVVSSACMRAGVAKMHPGAFDVPEPEIVEVPIPAEDIEATIARIRAALLDPDAVVAALTPAE
jgi:hypothetical protein